MPTGIGSSKFIAIVIDNASNSTFIFNNCYVAHCVNLITKDIIQIGVHLVLNPLTLFL
jgi:hypothetical protein